MRSKSRLITLLLTTAVAPFACEIATGPQEPLTVAGASGDGQLGSAGLPFEPLEVVVAGLHGERVDEVRVVWVVTSGDALFRVWTGTEPLLVGSVANQTGEVGPGRARAVVVPTGIGESTVTAYAAKPPGVSLGSVTFSVRTDAVSILLRDVEAFDQPWPLGAQGASLPLGTTLAFLPGYPCCTGQLRSISVPAGGTPFDYWLLDAGAALELVPDAVGEWVWVWEWETEGGWGWGDEGADTATFVVTP